MKAGDFRFRVWNGKFFKTFRICDDGLEFSMGADVEIEFYTGLKDKNGAEIYEGDILEFSDGTHKRRGVVIFDKAVFKLMFNREVYWHVGIVDKKDLEVLGNIHQNANLLDSKTQKEAKNDKRANQKAR